MMKTVDFPYAGYTVNWVFKDADDHLYKDYEVMGVPNEQIFEDMRIVLMNCMDTRLLFPTHLMSPVKYELSSPSTDLDQIMDEIQLLIKTRKIVGKIDICGYGLVEMPGASPAVQEGLILIKDFNFSERSFLISTDKSIWIPIAIDTSYHYVWQIELAEMNAPRLEKCLLNIHNKTDISVYPGPNDIARAAPMWQRGFKLYPSREVLERSYNEDPPPPSFDIAKYFLPPKQ